MYACVYCSVLPSISSCLIPTPTVRERRQGAVVTGGGPSGVLRPLADASESANQCDLGIEIERGVTDGSFSWSPVKISRSAVKVSDVDSSECSDVDIDECLSLSYHPREGVATRF